MLHWKLSGIVCLLPGLIWGGLVCVFCSRSRKRWHVGTRACRTVCVWATSPLCATEPHSLNSGQMDMPSRTLSSQHADRHKYYFCVYMLCFQKCFNTTCVCQYCTFQAARANQLAAGGHWEAEEAAGEEETSLYGPDASAQPGTEQTQEQEQRPREWSVRQQITFTQWTGYMKLAMIQKVPKSVFIIIFSGILIYSVFFTPKTLFTLLTLVTMLNKQLGPTWLYL